MAHRTNLTKTLSRRCPACSSSVGTLLHTQVFEASDVTKQDSSVDIVTCAKCGCGFSDLSVAQSDLDSSYEEHSKYADMTVFGQSQSSDVFSAESPWDLDRLNGTAAWLVGRFPDTSLSILDAGCATGTLLGLLKQRGYSNLTGLDPSPMAISRAIDVHGIKGVAGSFCNPPPTVGEYDLIVLSHVLEHIGDVQKAIDGLAEMTRLGGHVYLEVPDALRYAEFLVAPFHDFNDEHVNHFSGRILDNLMRSRGFALTHMGHKEVMIAPAAKYPAVFGLWEKSGRVETNSEIDHELIEALERYVVASERLAENINTSLAKRLSDRPVAVWGAGNLALKMLRSTALERRHVSAIVDGSPQRQGLVIRGVTVESPVSLRDFRGDVIVMSLHHADSIESSVREVVGNEANIIRLDS